jgi:hypothetical protein
MEEEIKGKGFVIKDRRQFDEKGDPRKGEEQTAPRTEGPEGARAGEEPAPGPGAGEGKGPGTERPHAEADYPPITFSDFIVSLSTSAIFHFGDIPDPVSGKAEKNLGAAKQTIDILGIIDQKTKGNLDDNEKKLMEAVLFELRMRYVKERDKA